MRTSIIAGNWKMNNNSTQTKQLLKTLKKGLKNSKLTNTRVLVAPAAVNLTLAVKKTRKSIIEVAAQNMHQAENGAFTGEISVKMLEDIGIATVILGHSERRLYFGETSAVLAEKATTALQNNLEVIFCFGELLEDRKSATHFNVVEKQLKEALFHLEAGDWIKIILAYEPVWAIGTGETASPAQAQEMHAFVRNLLAKQYNSTLAENTSILYGGSVKPNNAAALFSNKDIDGGLIGGAALNAADFTAIVNAI